MSMQVTDTLSFIRPPPPLSSSTTINEQGIYGPFYLDPIPISSTLRSQQQQQQQPIFIQHLQKENFFQRMTLMEKRLTILLAIVTLFALILLSTTIIFAHKYYFNCDND